MNITLGEQVHKGCFILKKGKQIRPPPPAVPVDFKIFGVANQSRRMTIKVRDLELKEFGRPDIIVIQEGNKISFCSFQGLVAGFCSARGTIVDYHVQSRDAGMAILQQ